MDNEKKHSWCLDTTDMYENGGSGSFNTIDLGNITMASTVTYPHASGSTVWGINGIADSDISISINPGGKIELRGEEADIIINGQSLMGKLDAISERLNLLKVNQELEQEWDQLRELGERYRQLEQELKDKSAMWKTLKTKTPSKPRS